MVISQPSPVFPPDSLCLHINKQVGLGRTAHTTITLSVSCCLSLSLAVSRCLLHILLSLTKTIVLSITNVHTAVSHENHSALCHEILFFCLITKTIALSLTKSHTAVYHENHSAVYHDRTYSLSLAHTAVSHENHSAVYHERTYCCLSRKP